MITLLPIVVNLVTPSINSACVLCTSQKPLTENAALDDNGRVLTESVDYRNIIRLHRRSTYVDAAYCYRLRSAVCLSVGLTQ